MAKQDTITLVTQFIWTELLNPDGSPKTAERMDSEYFALLWELIKHLDDNLPWPWTK